jgi:hypothetical protein
MERFSMFNNTDNELRRYEEAELYSATATPDMFSDIKSQFNTVTGQTDLLAPLPSGGFVRLASQAPDIMVEAPAMPGQGADAPLPVEGPIARAAEQTALETEPATAEMRPSLAGRTEVVKEVTKGLINGAIVQPANFLKENFGLYDPLAVQFVDPQTGEFDFKLHIMSREEKADLDAKMAAGELPYAMSLDDLVAPDKDASAVAGAAGGISQFLGAYLGIGKLFRVGSGFTGAMTQGAAADFLAFDGSDKAVTDMLLDMGWIEPNMITELLKKDPTDPDYVGRFQAAVEGAGLGAVIEKGLIPFLGLAFRAVKDKDVPVDAARQAIQQGKLMMQGALLKAGQNAELRMAERGPAVDFLSSTMMSGVDPTIATDPLVAAAGRAVTPELRLGPASDQEMFGQLAQPYRVTVEGFTPTGTGKQSMIPRKMTPGNFQATTIKLDELAQQFPDPLASDETYATMVATMQNVGEVSAPPRWMVEHANNIEQWADWFKGLTPDQIKAADEGLAVQKNFQDAYAAGAGPELTGQLMLWSILSRMLSAFPHEGGYIDLAEAATPFIQKAAAGNWSDADTAAWLEMVPNAIPEGAPGKSATSNANDFGKVFLKKMAAVDENGVSALTRLHEMVADPTKSSAEIRRAYYGLASDTGIANKILSFALLVSGRNDVVVLDRIQINRMWAGGDKVYDDIMKQFEGAQGLAQYEALERSLASKVGGMYEAAGRGDVGSVGRYHWESWVLSSGQIVAHPTLEGVVRAGAPDASAKIPPTASTPVSEGRFHRKYYGVSYEKLPSGGNRLVYKTSTGDPYQFTKPQLDDMFKEAFNKKSGVLPEDFPGVGAFEGGSIPWFEYEGVDRGKLDELIRQAGKPADN